MKNSTPRVAIGLPVYNGENYVREAIESILAQTFTDFRLLISDNASTDATGEICREYAQKDDRLIYYRQPENIGAAANFNWVFQPDGAPYFKWAAHDDRLQPDYLQRCVERLDGDPSVAIVHCPTIRIDKNGHSIGNYDRQLRLNGDRVRDRFWRTLWVSHFTEIFGVIRSDVLAQTQLYGSYVGSDRNLLAEILLLGDMGYVEEYLFCRRHHPESFCNAQVDNDSRLKWFAPKAKNIGRLAGWVKLQQYLVSLFELPVPTTERLACLGYLVDWVWRRGIESTTGHYNQYRRQLMAKLTDRSDISRNSI